MSVDPTPLAAGALGELQKGLKLFGQYPADHRMCQGAVRRILGRINEFLHGHGALELTFRIGGTFWRDTPLQARMTPGTPELTDLLEPAGIEGLTLHNGLTAEEVSDLLAIVAASALERTDADAPIPDVLTYLWQHEFRHVHIRVRDPLDGPAWQVQPEHREIEEFLTVCEAQASREGRNAGDETRDWAASELKQRDRLLEELRAPQVDAATRACAILEWAAGDDATLSARDVDGFYLTFIQSALWAWDLEQAINLLDKLSAGGTGERLSAEHTEQVGSLESLSQVLAALDTQGRDLGPQKMIEVGMAYLTRLHNVAVARVVQLYPSVENGDVRRVLRRFLQARVNEAVGEVVELTKSNNDAQVKEAVGILAVAGQDQGTPAWEALRRMAEDDEFPLRTVLAKQVVGKVTGETDQRLYLDVVAKDADRARRIAAANKLDQIGSGVIYEPLALLVESAEFAQNRDEEEIRAVFQVLTTVGGLRAVAVLERIAQRKTRLFGRKDQQRLRNLSTAWLQAMKEQR